MFGNIFNFFATIFGYVLNFLYNIVNNYGVAIIIFTVFLKALMLPINIKQQKTMKKSAKIQAKAKEIQDKYKNDPARMNQEIMDLYKSENMSPLSGCLSSILQMIIIISIFFVVSRPLTYLKHIDSSVIQNYTNEISQDGQRKNYAEIAIIKAKSEENPEVALNMKFLGLDLSDIPSENYKDFKVYIIPVLYVITSIVSMKLTSSINKTKNTKKEETSTALITKGEDEEISMDEMTKSMTYMAPIMSVSIALIAPLGLALYWFVSNLLTIVERLVLTKMLKEEEDE